MNVVGDYHISNPGLNAMVQHRGIRASAGMDSGRCSAIFLRSAFSRLQKLGHKYSEVLSRLKKAYGSSSVWICSTLSTTPTSTARTQPSEVDSGPLIKHGRRGSCRQLSSFTGDAWGSNQGCHCVCCWLVSVLPGVASPQQPDPFESLLASAQQAQARSDFQSAAEFYRKAVAIHPEIAELRANLGLMYYQTGKDQQAIDAFSQAIRLKPGLFVPNLFLGLDYVKLKRFNEAIPYLKRAVLLNATDIQARLALGHAYTGAGKTRQATESYSRVVQLDPNNADGWLHLGVSYLEQVEADSRMLVARHKDSGYFQTLVADTFAEQGAFIQAADSYKKALTFPAVPAGVHAAYGFVLLRQHDLAGAERELSAELASNPGSLMAKLGRARLHVEQGAIPRVRRKLTEIWKADASFLRAERPIVRRRLASAETRRLAAGFGRTASHE